jgi:molybdenum cofactor cytidylyltransferase
MVNTSIGNCAIVILAAGKSERLGSPKQLLSFKGKNLLKHAVDTALVTSCQSVFVVLGSNIELLREELKGKPVTVIENTGWEEGMASSIRCGLENIMKSGFSPDCVIFMVCDQPYVSSSLLLSLMEKKVETGMPIVASMYEDKMGTPALFDKTIFPELMKLSGDKGARKLISEKIEKVATVLFPEGITDIDTASDYESLKKENDN